MGQIVFTGSKDIRPNWPYSAKAIPLRKQSSKLMKKKSLWNPNLRRWMNKDDIHTDYSKLYKVSKKHEKLYRFATKKLSEVESE